jgi:hypothetical protein
MKNLSEIFQSGDIVSDEQVYSSQEYCIFKDSNDSNHPIVHICDEEEDKTQILQNLYPYCTLIIHFFIFVKIL